MINTSVKTVLKSAATLSLLTSITTSSASSSTIVLLSKIIYECCAVDSVPSSSISLIVGDSLLVVSSLSLSGEKSDLQSLEVAVS